MKRVYGGDRNRRFAGSSKRVSVVSDDDADVLLPFDCEIPHSIKAFSPELKSVDHFMSGMFTVPVTWSLAAWASSYLDGGGIVFNPAQGRSSSQRTGDSVIIKSWHVKGAFNLVATSNATSLVFPRIVSLFLIVDHQCRGALADPTHVFTASSHGLQTDNLCMIRNRDYGSRFEVLRSENFDMSPNSVGIYDPVVPDTCVNDGVIVPFEFFIPLDLSVQFKDDTSDLSDIVDRNLLVGCISTYDNSLFGTSYPSQYLNFSSRCRFICPGGPP